MIPGWPHVAAAALLAGLVWAACGWRWARLLLPELPEASTAPLLGFAVQAVLALWLLPVVGFGDWSVLLVVALALGSGFLLPAAPPGPKLGRVALVVAGALALLPMAAMMPKGSPDALRLAGPVYDHLKAAMVDQMLRAGTPPANPFVSGPGVRRLLPYYYGWHMQAGVLGRLAGLSGWGADAALTGVTAACSLLLVAGLAGAMGAPAWLGAALALPAGLWLLVAPLVAHGIILDPGGFGGWVNQASWAPQHMMAACLLLVSVLVLAGLAERGRRVVPGVLGLAALLAAGAACSAWVGGVTTAVVMPVCLLGLGWRARARAWRVFGLAALAALLAVALAAPVLRSELAGLGQSASVLPAFYTVLGKGVGGLRWLNPLAFPALVALVLPVPMLLGGWGLARALRAEAGWRFALALAALAAFGVAWGLRSAIMNNDLGWRAMLLPLLAGLPFAATFVARARGWRLAGVSLVLGMGLLTTAPMVRDNAAGRAPRADFAAQAAMWRAVRAATPPNARILSDPASDAAMTLWPANIGWALLADRPSCYAGWAAAAPFTRLPTNDLYARAQAVQRLFAGTPTHKDLALLPRLGCNDVLLTPESPAWAMHTMTSLHWPLLKSGARFRLYAVPAADEPGRVP